MNTPLVSWLMTVYNDERFLHRSLESMLKQTYTHFEAVIVVESGSVDNTLEICEQYAQKDKRIRVFVNESKLGFPESLNRGMRLCQGKYIARMDADDVSYEDRLEKQVRYMEENPDIDILGSQASVIHHTPHPEFITKCYSSEYIKARLLFSCCICHPSIMIRTEKFLQNKWQYPECKSEDYALWTTLISKAGMHIFPEPLLEYHIHGDNSCVVHVDGILENSSEISRMAMLNELGLDFTGFPDCLFGWREKYPVPNDLCEFLLHSAELLRLVSEANDRLCRFDKEALLEVLAEQWHTSKHIAGMNTLPDSYETFTKAEYEDTISRYNNNI